jgi:SAM-dependent methyltransferase
VTVSKPPSLELSSASDGNRHSVDPGRSKGRPVREDNKLKPEDRTAHQWYRFVLSYPPHLVRDYAAKFKLTPSSCVLDPFCGTGTTPVECKKLGIQSVGLEANPLAYFACRTKLNWDLDGKAMLSHAMRVAEAAESKLNHDGIGGYDDLPLFVDQSLCPNALRTIPAEEEKLLLSDSISPLPLHRTLVLLETLNEHCDSRFFDHERLAMASALVNGISNLHFGPEVGVGPAKRDAPVISLWLKNIAAMCEDLRELKEKRPTASIVHEADARDVASVLAPGSVDAVITSPPYPNEKDYTRTTRLESVLLGFIKSKPELQALKRRLVRSNTRGVYKSDSDDQLVAENRRIQNLADAIEQRRIELGKTSGFERLYSRVTKLYFGGMKRHLAELRTVLRPGAQLAYVVGDQASYLRVMIRTGELLAEIAESLGYEVTAIDLFRTRIATASGEQLREEVVLLKWPGNSTRV